jgi:catechol 2,3-dioxygenase-like lactoylglutathione lyase family enzyme
MAIQLNTVGIVVSDMSASLAFYRTLGLPVPDDQDAADNVEVPLPGGLTLGFLSEETARRADPSFIMPVGQRLNLQFAADSAAEVDATHARLLNAGYASHTAPWDAYWDQRFARIIDPNGLIVNVFAQL